MNTGYTGYTGVYAPVLRNPRLFHSNTGLSNPTYYRTQQTAARPNACLYPPYPPSNTIQSQFLVQAPLPSYPQFYPSYPASPRPMVPSPIPFSSYSIPTLTYAPTISSNGLALILIATLILVALDLMIVRPQKR